MSKRSTTFVVSSGGIVLSIMLGIFTQSRRAVPPPPNNQGGALELQGQADAPAEHETLGHSQSLENRASSSVPRQALPKPLDEDSLLATLHELAASEPLLSLKLAREAVARFPDSPHGSEFEWNVVKSLANMERYTEAREEARFMVNKYPGDEFTEDVYRHLLNHPPNPPDIGRVP